MHLRTTKILVGAAAIAMVASVQSAMAGDLVKFTIKDDAIAKSLTGKAGDPKKGRALAVNRKKGNCLACHAATDLKDFQFHGNTAPSLDGVAERMSEGELRLRIVDPKVANEDTMMPSFYKTKGFHRVMKKFQGKTILTAQEVEDVVAYLLTLK